MFDTERLFNYNAYDVVNTWEVNDELNPFLDTEYQNTYNFTERLLDPLMFMMTRGIKMDNVKLEEAKKQALEKTKIKQDELNTIAGMDLNVASPKQMKEYFYIHLGVKPYMDKGKVTTNDLAMQRMAKGTAARKGIPEARLVQEIRALRKLFGTYLDLDLDADSRFRCSMNPVGTRFGRLSSSKTIFGTGMNMQNLPAEFKQFIVPDLGYMMYEIDKAKAEWVVVAYLSGDANMIKVIEEGLDPHIHTSHLMTGVDKEIIELEDKVIGHTTDQTYIGELRNKLRRESPAIRDAFEAATFLPRNMSLRQAGKKSNHGLNYDEGYKTFALLNDILEADSKIIVNLYKNKAYPGVPIWHKSVQTQLRHDRTLRNCFGRKYQFLGAWDDSLFKAAYSFVPQSTVADLVNHGIMDTYYDTRTEQLDNELLGQVHDSILGQYNLTPNLHNSIAEKSNIVLPIQALRMAKVMKQTANYMSRDMEYSGRTFNIDNDMKIGDSWSNMKGADLSLPDNELAETITKVYHELWART